MPMLKEKMQEKIENVLVWLKPEQGAERGARWALLGAAGIVVAVAIKNEQIGIGDWAEWIVSVVFAVLTVVLAMNAMQFAVWAFGRLPQAVVAAGLTALIGATYGFSFSSKIGWPLWVGGVVSVLLLGGTIGALLFDRPTRGKRVWLLILLGVLLGGNGVFFMWLTQARQDPLDWVVVEESVAMLEMPDPAEVGEYAVQTLTYGSGTDRWRPEYGADVDLLTDSVSASNYVFFENWVQKTRKWYWGFDRTDFPLNGRVWYPDGTGSFPLVLIVHGNHAMTDFSDEGYAYLGELLASRGYIVASVDQNYLNGYFTGKVVGEDDARAWLLLQHLAVWEDWDADAASPFYNRVDLTNIALIGHSRGGEAVAIAAAFNELERNPNNATISWYFNFKIRTVIAIAPIDGYHQPGGKETPLQDLNYLVIQGAQDSDVNGFYGMRQYNRVDFSENSSAIKSVVYIHRANHGQFNTTWGVHDRGFPYSLFLNTSTLLAGEAQRQIAEVYISAFLAATLRGETGYLPFFQNHHVGAAWLPDALIINQYADAGDMPLVTFEEDIDVLTGTFPGVTLKGLGLSQWREVELALRKSKKQDDHAVSVKWNTLRDQFQISLSARLVEELGLDKTNVLRFEMGDGRTGEDLDTVLDLHVCLEDTRAQEACVLLSDYAQLYPQFRAQFSTWPLWEKSSFKDASEPVLQSYRMPLDDFLMQNPQFNLTHLHRINFVFDVTSAGAVYLDDVGFGE